MKHRRPCEHFRRYQRGPKLINRGIHYHTFIRKNPVRSDLMEWEKEELARTKKAGMSEEAAAKFLGLWEDVPVAMMGLRVKPEEEKRIREEFDTGEKVEKPKGIVKSWKDLQGGRLRILYTDLDNKLSRADIHGDTIKIGKDSLSKDQFFRIAMERFKRYNLPAPKSFDDILDRLQRRKDLLKMEKEWGARTSEETKGFKTAYPSFTFKDLQNMESFRKGFYEYPVVRIFDLPKESMAPKKILYDIKGRKEGRELGMLVDVRKIRPGKTFDPEHPTRMISRTIPQEIHYKIGRSLFPSEYKKPESRWSLSERAVFRTVGYPFKSEGFNAEYKGRYFSPSEYISNQEKKLLGGKIG